MLLTCGKGISSGLSASRWLAIEVTGSGGFGVNYFHEMRAIPGQYHDVISMKQKDYYAHRYAGNNWRGYFKLQTESHRRA